jgi:tRNA (pseudouridine54-N1)-methyltransferase
MHLYFFIQSETVDIRKYTIKDIPGSSGRLDVISRCILAALLNDTSFDKNIQIWIFLDRYGTFIFDSNLLNYETFPKNELKLTEYLVNYIKTKEEGLNNVENPLNSVQISSLTMIAALKQFIELNYQAYILNENGEDFYKYLNEKNKEQWYIFVVGNQTGEIINSNELKALNIPNVCLNNLSYLASSIIRLIKLNLLK